MNRIYRIALDAFYAFNEDDGWAIASHIALSALMALFPFLIFVTALAALFGTKELADQTAILLLEAWPKEVAEPIAAAIHDVLTNLRTDALTFGVVFAIYFSSSGIEGLRVGLNRAYGVRERHPWWWTRIESILYVFLGAISLLALAFLIVLGPLIWATATRYAPWLAPFAGVVDLTRYGLTTLVLVVALIVVHKWLPAGHRSFGEIAPGIAGDVRFMDCGRRYVRVVSVRIRLYLRHLLRRARFGDDRARVPLRDGVDLRLWRAN